MRAKWISLMVLLVLTLAGCGSPPAPSGQSPAMVTNRPQENTSSSALTNSGKNTSQSSNKPVTTEMTSALPDKDKLINLAKQNLADRLKIDFAQITLKRTTEITWPNISAGCSPGTAQILGEGRVYGYRVWLEANSDEFIYHTGEMDQVILCTKLNPGANNPLLMTPGVPTQDPWNQAP